MLLYLVAFFATYGTARGTDCAASARKIEHNYTPPTMNTDKSDTLTLPESGNAPDKHDTRTSITSADLEVIIPDPSEDVFQTDLEWLQGEEYEWGGSCECPSGATYQVAAQKGRGGSCGKFLCKDGVSGVCNMKKGAWSHNSVICKNKKVWNPHATGFNNIQKLFNGYNILLGNPLPFGGATDPGFQSQIFKITRDQNENTGDKRFWIPDNVDAFSCKSTCSLSMKAEVLRTESSYKQTLEKSVEWDTSVGGSLSFGPFSFGFGAAFGGSHEYQKIHEGYRQDQSQYVFSTATCCLYNFRHSNGGTYSTLDDGFVNHVLDLPLEYDQAAYGAFVEEYGTHYVKEVTMGSKYVEIDRIKMKDMESMRASHTNVQSSAEAKACFKLAEVAGFEAGGGYASSQSVSNQDQQAYQGSIASEEFVTLGALPPKSAADGREWTDTVVDDPQPIQVKLGYITDVLSDTFHSSYMTDPKLLAQKKANLETFMAGYCQTMKDNGRLSRDISCRNCIQISGAPYSSNVNGIYSPHSEVSSGGQETWINEDGDKYVFWNDADDAYQVSTDLHAWSPVAKFLSKDRKLPAYSQSGARMEIITCPSKFTTPPPTLRVIAATEKPDDFALVDGGPWSDQVLHEVFNPDPNQKLGEVQCCRWGQCTRHNPWNKRSKRNCISGYKDWSLFTLWEAKNMCASFGWSLCTRAEVDSKMCNKKGCGHDSAYVWVLENTHNGCVPIWNHHYDPQDYGSNERSVEKNPEDCAARCLRTEHCIGSSWWGDGGCHLSTYGATLKWSQWATASKCFETAQNRIQENAAGVGGWGGSCTCPDGSVYQVGDNHNSCGSLACIGGVSGTCNRQDGAWSRRKVICAPPTEKECLTLMKQEYDPLDYGSNGKSVEQSAADCAKRCLRTENCIGSTWWGDGNCHLATFGATLKSSEHGTSSKCFDTVKVEQAVADQESEEEMGSGDYESSSSMVDEAVGSMGIQQFVKLFALIGAVSIIFNGAKIVNKRLRTNNEEFHQINDAEC